MLSLARKGVKFVRDKITIIPTNNKHTFYEKKLENILSIGDFAKDKKLISISPGGFKGFYMMGICKYVKQNYDLENYIFTGASAGAWNSLLLCFKRDINEIQKGILDSSLQETNSINELENLLKNKILERYDTDDFDLRRLFIGVTTIENCKKNTTIFSGFHNLEDALNCCIASSHIPLITGGLTNIYRNVLTFDGGFSKYPYLNTTRSALHITPGIWKPLNSNKVKAYISMIDYTTLFSKDEFHFNEMIEEGFDDAKKHKEYLDNIFINDNTQNNSSNL